MGVAPTTGIAGLTLGGGLGWLMGKHGLACDNLAAATVVTADGAVLTASATDHPDLFWACAVAGAIFGIVTELEYRLHPLTTVLGGAVFYPVEKATMSIAELVEHGTAKPHPMAHAVLEHVHGAARPPAETRPSPTVSTSTTS